MTLCKNGSGYVCRVHPYFNPGP